MAYRQFSAMIHLMREYNQYRRAGLFALEPIQHFGLF